MGQAEAESGQDERDAAREHDRAKELVSTNKFITMIGGEHSVSAPIIRAHAEKYSSLSVLQIDAHADLRDSYEGTKLSHAAAMRRVLEVCPAVQVGIRSLSADEVRVIPRLPTRIFWAKDIAGRVLDSFDLASCKVPCGAPLAAKGGAP